MGSIRPTVRRKESGEINRGLDYLFNKQEQQCPRCMTAFWQLALRDTLAMLPVEGLTQQAHHFPHYRPSAWLPESPQHTAIISLYQEVVLQNCSAQSSAGSEPCFSEEMATNSTANTRSQLQPTPSPPDLANNTSCPPPQRPGLLHAPDTPTT